MSEPVAVYRYERPRPRWGLLILLLIIVCAVGAWIYYSTRPRAAVVVQRDIIGYLPATAQVVAPPDAVANVPPPYQAPVQQVMVRPGQHIHRGDVLMTLTFPSAPGQKLANIRAPITGTVTAVNALSGQVVGQDIRKPVATIVDLDRLEVQADVKPDQASGLKPGAPVVLTFAELPNQQFSGKVVRLTSATVPKVGGLIKESDVAAIIDFRNTKDQVQPGMKPEVAFKSEEAKDALAVPNEAVQKDASGKPIVKALVNGRWQPVVVQTGVSDGRYTQIKSGLQKGELVQVIPSVVSAANLPGKR